MPTTTIKTAAAALERPDDPTPASVPDPGDPRPAGPRTSGHTETPAQTPAQTQAQTAAQTAAEAGTDTSRTRRRRRAATTATTATTPATTVEPSTLVAGTSVAGGPAASAHDRVWAALRRHPATTASDLADTAGVARSTVAKLLAAWSEDGSATSTTGATARAARLWTATPSELPPDPASPDSNPDEPGSTVSAGAVPAEPPITTDHGVAANGADCGRAAVRAPATTTRGSTNRSGTNRSGTERLAAGALQGMVQDYLSEHPGEHGPTAIGHALGRSSGAIANSLERLVAAGWAELTQDRPRRYRSPEHPDATETRPANTSSGTATDTAND